MSDSEDDFKILDDEGQGQGEQQVEQQPEETQAPQRPRKQGVYKKARDDDKRKETSKLNIEKARMVRNYKLNEKKKKRLEATLDKLNQVEVDDEESEEEDEIVLTKTKKKKQTGAGTAAETATGYSNARLDRIEGILTKLARKHKPTPAERKTIIQLTQPEAKKEEDEVAKHFKNKLLLKL